MSARGTRLGFATVLLLAGCSHGGEPETRWRTLFGGDSLDGWHIVNGDVPFTVEDGAIVGRTALGIPTRYLATDDHFGDFILTLEMDNSEGDNSGIQFRSLPVQTFRAGLTGYQLEVDPTDRGWTGGIFFEGLGRWRYPITDSPDCAAAWDASGWNRLRIEARGEHMRTFVNDRPCADLFDDTMDRGHIALQIHSINHKPERAVAPTRWRNIRILDAPSADDYTPTDSAVRSVSYLNGRLSARETQAGWTLLPPDSAHGLAWSRAPVANDVTGKPQMTDMLDFKAGSRSDPLPSVVAANGFEWVADIQMDAGSRGRITYPVPGAACSSSFALFDDGALPKKTPPSDNHMGAIPGRQTAGNLSEPNRRKRVLPADQWQRIRIVTRDRTTQHWLNAVKVAEVTGCGDRGDAIRPTDRIQVEVEAGAIRLHTVKYKGS